uniref:Uncharacterized protein n=1 Tax=uncultured Caudovirales phage TaxID=2100421 RepID=A0A6J5L0Z6_9CAUD|nr:hypothetical protein UFOVP114_28 [uncultured Caudovirales phage]
MMPQRPYLRGTCRRCEKPSQLWLCKDCTALFRDGWLWQVWARLVHWLQRPRVEPTACRHVVWEAFGFSGWRCTDCGREDGQ